MAETTSNRVQAEALRERAATVLGRKAEEATLRAAGHSWALPGGRCKMCREEHPCPPVRAARTAIRLRDAIHYVTDAQLLALVSPTGIREA